MARRKRRTCFENALPAEEPKQEVITEWRTAVYVRLSAENGTERENLDSIEGQTSICKAYIEEHPFLRLAEVYTDNGWSGTNTERPAFKKMLGEIYKGNIKAVVVKDFSRFSRDYIEAGELLENVFPFWGVRFISAAEQYDSFETDGTRESLLIPLKNLINSFYAKDISKKITTSVHAKQLAGEYLSGMISYGYQKSETEAHRLIPDPETAGNVTRIFQLRAAGASLGDIADTFNKEGIPSAGRLKWLRGQTKIQTHRDSVWRKEEVKHILANPCYLGQLVFGRMPRAMYLGQPKCRRETDTEKWRVLEQMHEPLTTQELFDTAQEMAKRDREKWLNKQKETERARALNPPFFHGYLFCGDCGSSMIFRRYQTTLGPAGKYYCGKYRYGRCGGTHSISQNRLKKIVWQVLSDQLTVFCEFEKVLALLKTRQKELSAQKADREEIRSVLAKMKAARAKRERLYEDHADGILSAEEYQYMKQKYDEAYHTLNARFELLSKAEQKRKKALSEKNQWMVHMKSVRDAGELTREVMEAMVEKILIFQEGKEIRAEVILNYKEDFEALRAAQAELFGEEKG